MNRNWTYRLHIFLFLLPALILFCTILIAPIFISFRDSLYSFSNFTGSDKQYVGISERTTLDGTAKDENGVDVESNYDKLFKKTLSDGTSNNPKYIGDALITAFILAALSTFIQLPIALAIALCLGKGIRGERSYLTIFFMPVLISTVIIGQLWFKIYDPKGVLNAALHALGVDKAVFQMVKDSSNSAWPFTGQWLAKGFGNTALFASFIPVLWQYIGYHALLMYAGVKGVPADLLEAARLDGCTEGQINRHIIIPYIKPILRVSVIFAVTGSLKSFDLFQAMFGRDNDPAVSVPSMLLYRFTSLSNEYGLGSAVAVILIILCFVFALLINLLFRNKGDKVA